jgi:hypothetical protein
MSYQDFSAHLHQNGPVMGISLSQVTPPQELSMVMGMRLTQVTLSQEGLLLFLMGSSLLHLNPGWQYITTLLLMMGSMRYYSPTNLDNIRIWAST